MPDPLQEVLDKLPSKIRPTLKDQVREHLDTINDARSKGYTYRELTQILKEEGVTIACSTLKKYVQQLNRASVNECPNVLSLPKLK